METIISSVAGAAAATRLAPDRPALIEMLAELTDDLRRLAREEEL